MKAEQKKKLLEGIKNIANRSIDCIEEIYSCPVTDVENYCQEAISEIEKIIDLIDEK